jgi:hypothetical protein
MRMRTRVIGCLVAVAIIASVVYFLSPFRRTGQQPQAMEARNAGGAPDHHGHAPVEAYQHDDAHPEPHSHIPLHHQGSGEEFPDGLTLPDHQDFDEGIDQLADFFPIHEDTIQTMLWEIPTENAQVVPEAQLQSLRSVLQKGLLAYKHGSADEILADRLRVQYSILPEATAAHVSS